MSCPHSSAPSADPKKCSLCIGVTPRIVAFDPSTERMTIDGTDTGRKMMTPVDLTQPVHSRQKAARARMGQRGMVRRCSNCGREGHTRLVCGRQQTIRKSTEDDQELN